MDGQLEIIIPAVPSKYYYCPNKLSLSRFSVDVTTMKPFWQLEGEHYLYQTTMCKQHRFTQNVIIFTEIALDYFFTTFMRKKTKNSIRTGQGFSKKFIMLYNVIYTWICIYNQVRREIIKSFNCLLSVKYSCQKLLKSIYAYSSYSYRTDIQWRFYGLAGTYVLEGRLR